MTIYGPRKGIPVSGYANRAQRRKGVHYGAGLNLANHTPRRQGYEPKVPPGPYSERGMRVEAAVVELERIVARLEARLA